MSSYCFCVRCEANVSRAGSQNKKDECGVEENKDKLEHIGPTVTPESKLEPTRSLRPPMASILLSLV